jgi:hypothetical protein
MFDFAFVQCIRAIIPPLYDIRVKDIFENCLFNYQWLHTKAKY